MADSVNDNGKAFVRFEKIEKSFDGETLVIKNLNLEIAQGEFLTMLGPSGSGKTTTLMMLAGFETPTHGEIFWMNGQSATFHLTNAISAWFFRIMPCFPI